MSPVYLSMVEPWGVGDERSRSIPLPYGAPGTTVGRRHLARGAEFRLCCSRKQAVFTVSPPREDGGEPVIELRVVGASAMQLHRRGDKPLHLLQGSTAILRVGDTVDLFLLPGHAGAGMKFGCPLRVCRAAAATRVERPAAAPAGANAAAPAPGSGRAAVPTSRRASPARVAQAPQGGVPERLEVPRSGARRVAAAPAHVKEPAAAAARQSHANGGTEQATKVPSAPPPGGAGNESRDEGLGKRNAGLAMNGGAVDLSAIGSSDSDSDLDLQFSRKGGSPKKKQTGKAAVARAPAAGKGADRAPAGAGAGDSGAAVVVPASDDDDLSSPFVRAHRAKRGQGAGTAAVVGDSLENVVEETPHSKSSSGNSGVAATSGTKHSRSRGRRLGNAGMLLSSSSEDESPARRAAKRRVIEGGSARESLSGDQTPYVPRGRLRKSKPIDQTPEPLKASRRGSLLSASSPAGSQSGSVDPCAICLEVLQLTTTASLACPHRFHFSCIEMWAKKATNCPLCKTEFTAITRADGTSVAVEPRKLKAEDSQEGLDAGFLVDAGCMICGGTDNEEVLLLCDMVGCENMAHTYCMRLSAVPEGDWYCQDCLVDVAATDSDDGEYREEGGDRLLSSSDDSDGAIGGAGGGGRWRSRNERTRGTRRVGGSPNFAARHGPSHAASLERLRRRQQPARLLSSSDEESSDDGEAVVVGEDSFIVDDSEGSSDSDFISARSRRRRRASTNRSRLRQWRRHPQAPTSGVWMSAQAALPPGHTSTLRRGTAAHPTDVATASRAGTGGGPRGGGGGGGAGAGAGAASGQSVVSPPSAAAAVSPYFSGRSDTPGAAPEQPRTRVLPWANNRRNRR